MLGGRWTLKCNFKFYFFYFRLNLCASLELYSPQNHVACQSAVLQQFVCSLVHLLELNLHLFKLTQQLVPFAL